MRIRFNSIRQLPLWRAGRFILLALICLSSATAYCADVSTVTARQVAQGVLQHHVALFGHWNGSLTPAITGVETVRDGPQPVAYNFTVQPSGHILVTVADELDPVPFYSTTSGFDPSRVGNPNAIESWIVPELEGRVAKVREFRRRIAAGTLMRSATRKTVKKTWDHFRTLSGSLDTTVLRSLDEEKATVVRTATVAPLLTTTWDQGLPYSLQTPDDGCSSGHTYTGCVATAWAQVLNYWEWPDQGVGSHSYVWTGDTTSATLAADFGATNYDWAHMPDVLTDASGDEEKAAVPLLMYHLGVATDMEYGCKSSGTGAWANEILDLYFKYKTMGFHSRSSYVMGEQWFNLFQEELDASPPRPVIFSIDASQGWHEVVVDGYQDGPPRMVHINFGWDGQYDGYYDITDDGDFNTEGFDWSVNTQYIVTGIEPYEGVLPVVTCSPTIPASLDEGDSVTLSGTASHASGIASYEWRQISGPTAVLTHADSAQASIVAPIVSSDSQMVFLLKAVNLENGVGFDTVAITVRDAGRTAAGSSSGGGGGCFVLSLFY